MKRLTLVRHATAGHAPDDRSRPLSPAGREEAGMIAAKFAPLASDDCLILASPALRTRETAAALEQALGDRATCREVSGLYLAEDDEICALLMGETAEHIIVVAHNPGIGQMALRLGGGHDAFIRGFAPATLAHFNCAVGEWAELAPGNSHLVSVITSV